MSMPAESETSKSHLRSASEHLGLARDHITVGVADAVNSGVDAAREAKAELDDKLEKMMDQGKDLLGQAEDLIRSRPWASFGVAFAAGFLIAKLTRRN
jgi:ElaB/YqjD/DUF883 family membrane-anchored ribosome-binding protein